ncbi:Altered inheritance of mitochondria protein 41 mitochondrial [Ceratocystis lukuohia]|uniref:Altered inheritance of mitochondria protein 41 n=1 Tax=Ceratocystis lukuohia TaxID=2019550 RepID=A0ABR4MAD4_9PEZI
MLPLHHIMSENPYDPDPYELGVPISPRSDGSPAGSDDSLLDAVLDYAGRDYHVLSVHEHIHYEPIDFLSYMPTAILDCGAGSCTWAIAMATMFPNCHVVAIDIAFTLIPDEIPFNLEIKRANLNESLPFDSESFDIVNSRMVAGGVEKRHWVGYLHELKRITKRGGFVQMAEMDYQPYSRSNQVIPELMQKVIEQGLGRWGALYYQTMSRRKDPEITKKLYQMMCGVGFVDIASHIIMAPTCSWPEEAYAKELGHINQSNVQLMLGGTILFSLMFIERLLEDDIRSMQRRAQYDANNHSLQAYFNVYTYLVQLLVTSSQASYKMLNFAARRSVFALQSSALMRQAAMTMTPQRLYSTATDGPALLGMIKSDLKTAMRAKDAPRLAVLRAIMSATLNASKTASPIKTDVQLVALLRKNVAASKDAAAQFKGAGREDLEAKELGQVAILEAYIANSGVQSVGLEQLKSMIAEKIEEAKAAGAKSLVGEVMKRMSAELEGKDVDKKEVSALVKQMAESA